MTRRFGFFGGVLFLAMTLALMGQDTRQQQRDLLEDLIFDGTNGECWVKNDAVSGGGNWDTCGAGGSITGSGTDTYVTYWTGASSISGEAAFTYDDATNALGVDGPAVFNESGADVDHRIEGDNQVNAFFLDASTDRIGMGTASPSYDLHVYRSAATSTVVADSGDATTYAAMAVTNNGGSTVGSSWVAYGPSTASTFLGTSAAGNAAFGFYGAGITAAKFGTDLDIPFIFGQRCTGCGESTGGERWRLAADGTVVVNENSLSYVDLRAESDNQASCFLVDASADVVSAACDVQFPNDSIETGEIEDGTIREVDLMAVNSPTDEYCLTYEATVGDFEWQTCGSGGGDSITVNSSAATDPDFLNGDIDWTLTGGNSITATVACSGCIDSTDLGTDAVSSGTKIADGAVGEDDLGIGNARVDEYCLTWEDATNDMRWQQCIADADYGDISVSGGAWSVDADAVGSAEIATDAVGSAEIATDAVGSAEIATGAVGSSEISDGSIQAADIDITGVNTDEFCLTWETSTGDFAWQSCVSDTDKGDITVSTSGTNWQIDSESILESDLAIAVGPTDEWLLSYESTGSTMEWKSPCDVAWPVDSIFISMSSTNPGTSLGCGTWSAFGAGRVLVSLDSVDTSWDTAGETGGSKTHNHTFTTGAASAGATQRGTTASTLTLGNHTHSGTTNSDNGIAMPYIAVYMWRRTA